MRVQLLQNQQKVNPSFGFKNFRLNDGFLENMARRLSKEELKEVADTFERIAAEPKYARDERHVLISTLELGFSGDGLGDVYYPFNPTAESITNLFERAFEDAITIKSLPEYAKAVSKKLGISLECENRGMLKVGCPSRCRDFIDYVGRSLAQFHDRAEIKATLSKALADRDLALVLRKNDVSADKTFLANSNEQEVWWLVDDAWTELHRKMGDAGSRELQDSVEEHLAKLSPLNDDKLAYFADLMQKVLGNAS